MSTGINVTKPIKILDEGVLLTSDVSQIDFTGGVTATTSGNNVTVNVPAAGITVGTTPVTSGTDGRVFFQAGGVVQQSPKFTFNGDTLKLLGKDYTASNNIIDFKNHLDTIELLKMNGLGKLKIGFDSSNVDGFVFEPQLAEFSQLAFGGLKIHSLTNSIGYFGFGVASYKFGIGNNSPQARLDVRAQGALSTDIAFRVRNSADTANLVSFTGNGDIAIGSGATGVTNAGYEFVAIGTTAKASQYGVSIGANVGKNQDNGDRRNVYIGVDCASSGTNQTNAYNVGIGSSVFNAITSGVNNVAIGGGSTDAAARALTSGANNVMIGYAAGNQITTGANNTFLGGYSGFFVATGSANTQIGWAVSQASGQNKSHNTGIGIRMQSSHDGTIMIGSSGDTNTNATSIANDAAQFHFRSTSQSFFFNKNTNVVLRSNSSLTSGTHFEAAATNTITIHNGTAPVANITDAYAQYSADITAGNAAPHFRTEAGDIIKLYKETTAVTAATLVSGLGTPLTDTDTFDGYTLKQIVKALRNQGLLA